MRFGLIITRRAYRCTVIEIILCLACQAEEVPLFGNATS
jgi:hypothetical protein